MPLDIPQDRQRTESNLNNPVNLFSDADIGILIITHFGAFERAQFKRSNCLTSTILPN